MPEDRRLAAIMFTDIVGYTALMGIDEDKALRLLERNRNLHKPIIERNNGTFLKEIGDAILASFQSVYNAVKCAEEIIKTTRNVPDLSLRIGIHEGEVVFKEGDIYGDGVNVASRIQELAIPDSVLISGRAHDEIKNKSEIKVKSLGTFQLRNVSKPMEIYAISNPGLSVPEPEAFQILKHDSRSKISVRTKNYLISGVIAIIILCTGGYYFMQHNKQKQEIEWANTVALPAIQKYMEEYIHPGRSEPGWEALDLANKARDILKDNAIIEEFFNTRTQFVYLSSDPEMAEVYLRPYSGDTTWRNYGHTPVFVTVPNGISQVKLTLEGYAPFCDLILQEWNSRDSLHYKLDNKTPEGMVYIPTVLAKNVIGAKSSLQMTGLEDAPLVTIADFYMDKYEVTNKDYKQFVDAGGYRIEKYWKHDFIDGQEVLNFDVAMSRLIDKTGKPGPATWEVSTYPEGTENHPVAGISWYEAAAYAEFAGKKLPTIYHWDKVALTRGSFEILNTANINSTELRKVGKSLNRFGVFDMAGNVREWCRNRSDDNERYILGGGWNDLNYSFYDVYAQPEFNRSIINGFRCIIEVKKSPDENLLNAQIALPHHNFYEEPIATDEVFEIYLRQFSYDNTELNAEVKDKSETDEYTREYVEFNAAYGNERMTAYIFIPKKGKPPYQTVIYFPGDYPIYINSSKDLTPFPFIINSGRAFVCPILKSTYERRDQLTSTAPNKSIFWKEHLIMWVKDVSRTIDYLETRDDIDNDEIAYLGLSWGGRMGAFIPAIEKRIKANILLIAGLKKQRALAEVEAIHYLPRISTPTIMLNGKYDFYFPYETSQKPFFDLLGTPNKDKKIVVYEGSHSVPWLEVMKESLAWLDNYLGPVETITITEQ